MHHADHYEYMAESELHTRHLLDGSNLPSTEPLEIDRVLLSKKSKPDGAKYVTTSEYPWIKVDSDWILWTRHHTAYRKSTSRDKHIYAKWTLIPQERHILAWTDHMSKLISENLDHEVTPELLWLNMVLKRQDWESVYLDWLPVGTDFMVYPDNIVDLRDKTKLIVNMKLMNHQQGCGTLWKSIAEELWDSALRLAVPKVSKHFRWSVLKIHGPKWEHFLEAGQKVFVRIPTGIII